MPTTGKRLPCAQSVSSASNRNASSAPGDESRVLACGQECQRGLHARVGNDPGQSQWPADVQSVHQQIRQRRIGACARRCKSHFAFCRKTSMISLTGRRTC